MKADPCLLSSVLCPLLSAAKSRRRRGLLSTVVCLLSSVIGEVKVSEFSKQFASLFIIRLCRIDFILESAKKISFSFVFEAGSKEIPAFIPIDALELRGTVEPWKRVVEVLSLSTEAKVFLTVVQAVVIYVVNYEMPRGI